MIILVATLLVLTTMSCAEVVRLEGKVARLEGEVRRVQRRLDGMRQAALRVAEHRRRGMRVAPEASAGRSS